MRRVLGKLEGLQRGYLRLGASTNHGLCRLPEVLGRFRRKYPDVESTLVITNSTDVTRRVLACEFDLGFVGAPAEAPGLQVRRFAGDEIVLIVPAGHTLARQRAFASDLLARETLIAREAGSATRQITEANLVRLGLSPRQVLEMSGCEAVKRAVSVGLGVAFVSRYAIALELVQKLVSVPEIPELHFSRQLFLIARKDARPSAAALAFLALMQKGEARQGRLSR